jgi:hypothetical protein
MVANIAVQRRRHEIKPEVGRRVPVLDVAFHQLFRLGPHDREVVENGRRGRVDHAHKIRGEVRLDQAQHIANVSVQSMEYWGGIARGGEVCACLKLCFAVQVYTIWLQMMWLSARTCCSWVFPRSTKTCMCMKAVGPPIN